MSMEEFSQKIDNPQEAEAMARASNEDWSRAAKSREELAAKNKGPGPSVTELYMGKGISRHGLRASAEISDDIAERTERLVQKAIKEVIEETRGLNNEELKEKRNKVNSEILKYKERWARLGGANMEEGAIVEDLTRKLEVYDDMLSGALEREEDKAAKLSQEIKDRL